MGSKRADEPEIKMLAQIVERMGAASPHEMATAIFCWLPTAGYRKHEKQTNGRWRRKPKTKDETIRTSDWVRVPTESRLVEVLMYHDDMNPQLTAQRIITALKDTDLAVSEIVAAESHDGK